MEIQPLYNNEHLVVSHLRVHVSDEDRREVAELIERSKKIGPVADQPTFLLAKRAAGELKAKLSDITDSKRAAKRPFEAVLGAIEDLAKEILAPVNEEQKRILGNLNSYVQKLEEEAKEAERKKKEELDRQEKAHQEKLREMEQARLKAEEAARQAQDAVEKERALNEAARKELAAAQLQLARAMELEVAAMVQEPKKGLVPDGRVNHPLRFKLVNPEATVKAGCIRLLRIELNILNCQDNARAQLEIEPDKLPQLPGIEVTRETSVSVKATSRIS